MRVLIVDDNSGYRRLLRRVLEAQRDVDLVFEACDGEEGIRLSPQQFKPDVVLMDIDMPGINGLEAAPRLKQSLPGAAVVIVSALDDETSRQRAAECGADAFLPKTASHFCDSLDHPAFEPDQSCIVRTVSWLVRTIVWKCRSAVGLEQAAKPVATFPVRREQRISIIES